MVKAAEHRPRDHSAGGLQGRDNGTPEFEAAVRTIAVVIVGKFGEHGLQVALIDHDEVVETFRSNGPHEPRRSRSPSAPVAAFAPPEMPSLASRFSKSSP